MRSFLSKSVLILSLIIFGACKDGSKNTTESTGETHQHEEVVEVDTRFSISIGSNDQMQYDKNELKVPVGEPIVLTLSHNGQMPKAAMGHNFVILKQGVDFMAFAEKAVLAADTDYIPESEIDNIIAHTKVLGGGESDTIEFVIEEAGTYEFLCTFPGHYALMKGVVIAE